MSTLLFGLGMPEVITSMLFPIIIIVIIFFFVRRKGNVQLSLSKFVIQPESEDLIIIEGRKTGLIQWFLVKLNLGNTFQIKIKKDHITYSADSAAGNSLVLVPIHKVSSTSCGYEKPIRLLVFSAILAITSLLFLFTGAIGLFLVLILLAALLCFFYIYMKNFFISIETTGSTRMGFSFKRSYIENVPIDIKKIEEGIRMINELVIKNK